MNTTPFLVKCHTLSCFSFYMIFQRNDKTKYCPDCEKRISQRNVR